MKAQLVQKQVYRKINAFSNKVTRKEYAAIADYQKDILEFFVIKTNCIGGLFVTVYDQTGITYFKERSFNDEQIEELFQKWDQEIKGLLHPRIITPDNLPFEFVLEIPIVPDDHRGMLFLFDNHEYTLKFFRDFIFEFVNITMHRDLDRLACHLQFERKH